MRTLFLWSVPRFMALFLMLGAAAMVHAQSAADQAIKTLPQQMKDNGENRVVTKSNTVSNNAMNKLDSAGNKAFKGVTGIFKKKKKKASSDSTVVHPHPADSTAMPKTSSFIINIPINHENASKKNTAPRAELVMVCRRLWPGKTGSEIDG